MTRLYKMGNRGKLVEVKQDNLPATVEQPTPPLMRVDDYIISEGEIAQKLMEITEVDTAALFEIFTHKRSKGTAGEKAIIDKYLTSVTTKDGVVYNPTLVPAGEGDHNNILFDIPNTDGSASTIMWSCHTDSVHRKDGRQWITMGHNGIIRTSTDAEIDLVDPLPPASEPAQNKKIVNVEGLNLATDETSQYSFEEVTTSEAWQLTVSWRDPMFQGQGGYYHIQNVKYHFAQYPGVIFNAEAVRKIGGKPYNYVSTHKPSRRGECLGADDGAGLWIMLMMMRAGVPGLYAFHYGEEAGCVGSKNMAKIMRAEKTKPEAERSAIGRRLLDLKVAVAFDRKGTTEVITHQRGGRCCSDNFAKWLAAAINLNFPEAVKYTLAPSDNGVYTDTASYTDYIPECTNIAVGYVGQHGEQEVQDLRYLFALVMALTSDDFVTRCHTPVVERDPTKYESKWGGGGHAYGAYGGHDDFWEGAYGTYGGFKGNRTPRVYNTTVDKTTNKPSKSAAEKRAAKEAKRAARIASRQDDGTLMWLMRHRPDIIAAFCNQMQIGRREIESCLPGMFEKN